MASFVHHITFRFNTVAYISPLADHTMSQINPIHNLTSHFFKIYFDINHRPSFSSCDCPTKILYAFHKSQNTADIT